MNDTNERRRFTRFTFDAPAQLHQGERQWAAPVDDISLKGVLLARPAEWSAQPSATYQLRILLNDETQVSMDVELVGKPRSSWPSPAARSIWIPSATCAAWWS